MLENSGWEVSKGRLFSINVVKTDPLTDFRKTCGLFKEKFEKTMKNSLKNTSKVHLNSGSP